LENGGDQDYEGKGKMSRKADEMNEKSRWEGGTQKRLASKVTMMKHLITVEISVDLVKLEL
jgi:hypothetical protein